MLSFLLSLTNGTQVGFEERMMDFSNWPEPKRTRWHYMVEQEDRGNIVNFLIRDTEDVSHLYRRTYYNVTVSSLRRLQRAVGHRIHKSVKFPVRATAYYV